MLVVAFVIIVWVFLCDVPLATLLAFFVLVTLVCVCATALCAKGAGWHVGGECNYVKERLGGDDGFLSIFCESISTVVDCLPMVEN